MSLSRDTMPSWELLAALNSAETEITRLRAKLEKAKETLRPFASPRRNSFGFFICPKEEYFDKAATVLKEISDE